MKFCISLHRIITIIIVSILLLLFISLSVYAVSDVSNLAEEVVRLASSQINKTKGDGEFAGLIWADADVTYCERFISAVITVASGKNISEQKIRYSTADADESTRHSLPLADPYIDLLKESEEPPKGAVVYLGRVKGDIENVYGGYVGISDGEGNVIGAVNATQGVLSKPIKSFKSTNYGWIFPEEWDTPVVAPPKVGKDLPKTFTKKDVSIMLISVEAFPPSNIGGSFLSKAHITIKITNNTYNSISPDIGSARIVADGHEFRVIGYPGINKVKPGVAKIANNISFPGLPANINKITIYIPYVIEKPSWEEIEAEFEVEFY